MKIDVQIKNKIARLTKPAVIVCGNSDYVIKFDFDAEWADYQTKTARFSFGAEYADVIFDGDEVLAPVLKNTVAVSVGVYAGDIRTTTAAVIPCLLSVTSSGGIPADPTSDVYVQIMEKLNTRIKEPPTEGTAGQVLTTDGNGGRYWADQTGGGEAAMTDDDILDCLISTDMLAAVADGDGAILTDENGKMLLM